VGWTWNLPTKKRNISFNLQ
jgi:hypothetical protein